MKVLGNKLFPLALGEREGITSRWHLIWGVKNEQTFLGVGDDTSSKWRDRY